MSQMIGNGRASTLRATLLSGIVACAVQGCGVSAPPEGTFSQAGDNVTTVKRAATGVVCDPNPAIPCVTTDNGRVLHNLKIINMFMSADWDNENAGTPFTKQAINDFTKKLVTTANANQYFSAARTDYEGAGTSVSFYGDFDATGVQRIKCFTPSVDNKTEALSIHAWMTCMTAPGELGPIDIPDLGINGTFGNIPPPDDATLYVIYVPKGTDVVDKVNGTGFKSCDDFHAYHFWNATMKWDFDCGLNCHDCAFDFCSPFCCICAPGCSPTLVGQTYTYAVVPVECAKDASGAYQIDKLTEALTHEMIEAAVDPIVPTGWLDRGKQEYFPLFGISPLLEGEISDLCADGSRGPATVPLSDGTSVSTYWSTSQAACVPKAPVIAKCQDVTVPTPANSCSATASVNNGSSDPSGGALTLTQSPPGPYGLGTTTVTLNVSSPNGSATCTGRVTVVDRTPPVFTSVPGPVTAVEGTTPNIGTATATDVCPGAVTVTNNVPATFPIGVTTVTWTARDAAGNTATATQTVRVSCAGGPSSCPDGHGCQTNDDCGSRVCTNGVCAPPTCAPHCNRGALCGASTDCGSQVCIGNTCRASACSPRCAQDGICGDSSDCLSFNCSANNRCLPSLCSPNCNVGAPCGANTDCLARRCLNGICAAPTCSPSCGPNALCNNNGDCASHFCNGNRCR